MYYMIVILMVKNKHYLKVKNHQYLYFIVINNKNNMFRHYVETIIHNSYKHTKHNYNYNYNSRIFIFSLINK